MLTPSSALSIAGSDPSGGAGIQVDLKTFAALGLWGMAVITSLTAQNSFRVSGTMGIPPDFVGKQIDTLLEDITPGAVKTGMLANAGIIRAVIDHLPDTIPLVVDPVLVSTSGHRLLCEDAIGILRDGLIPRADLVTPNIPEAMVLTGMERIVTEDEMEMAGGMIRDMGAGSVVIKGGHGAGDDSVDLLVTDRVIRLLSPREPYSVHGSGCCFSAAITGYIAKGEDIPEACRLGKEVISRAIRSAVKGSQEQWMANPGDVHLE